MLGNIHIKNILGLRNSTIPDAQLVLFAGLAVFSLFSIVLALALEELLLLGIPFGLLLVYQTVVDFRKIYFLLLATIPISTEFYFSSSLATDLPTEPLVAGLMMAFVLYVCSHWKTMSFAFVRHPLTVFLLIHLAWMFLTTITSQNLIVSIKFMIAKTWYIIGYFFLTGYLIKTQKNIKQLFWVIFIPFFLAVLITLARHAMINFSFEDVQRVMKPFFRNHVLYAAILAIFLPFIALASTWYKRNNLLKWFLLGAVFITLAAIYYSYTRTAYIAVFIATGAFFIIRLRLVKIVLLTSLIALVGGIFYIVNDNKYLDYAPDFEKTVSHYEFENLVDATAKGQDVSTMERVYRWVAGMQMSKEELLTGYGPGNFYNFYKPYAVTSFETYVSDNPEKSGIHSYYLMVLTEQGVIGALIFLFFTFFTLIVGENMYHRTQNTSRKNIIMALLLSLIIIDAFLLINDMIETDKVGSFYFINIALLVNLDIMQRREIAKKC